MLLTDDEEAAKKVRKWSTQARENAPWYQHEEVGYNYRMSNVIAGVVRGQYPYLKEHIRQKKAIYERYKEGLPYFSVTSYRIQICISGTGTISDKRNKIFYFCNIFGIKIKNEIRFS